MTIYAIVNNFLSSPESTDMQPPIWTLISQAAILQGGNPFFVPDFANRFEARPALALKIGRLGKGIAQRFAYRYIEAAAPAILFVAVDLLSQCIRSGLPWMQAISYDRALALGKFTPLSLEECKKSKIILTIESLNNSFEESWTSKSICPGIEDTIAAISRDNALKMGDIVLVGLSGSGPEIHPGMRAHLSLNNSTPLAFNIR